MKAFDRKTRKMVQRTLASRFLTALQLIPTVGKRFELWWFVEYRTTTTPKWYSIVAPARTRAEAMEGWNSGKSNVRNIEAYRMSCYVAIRFHAFSYRIKGDK